MDKHDVEHVFDVVNSRPESQVTQLLIVPAQVAQLESHTLHSAAVES